VKKSLAKSIGLIRDAGFSHLKVELEGQLYREDAAITCEACQDGYMNCPGCGGEGVVNATIVKPDGAIYSTGEAQDCDSCRGDGGLTCTSCHGSGDVGTWGDNQRCHQFILDYVLKHAYGSSYAEMREKNPVPDNLHYDIHATTFYGMPDLTFGMFYHDGSVDSEYTFTIPVEKADVLPVYLKAFDALGDLCSGVQTSGAGMHISVLPRENNGRYPGDYRMPERRVQNFTREVSKLLPALFFVGTAGHQTRPLNYRAPRISNSSKYSAIYTHARTCFEYRVFETCYDRPEAIFDFISVIANTLKFYVDPDLKVKELGKDFGFMTSRNIADHYSTPEQLRILNATVKWLKPEDKSYKQLKDERGMRHTIKSLNLKERVRLAQLRREYKDYERRWQENYDKPLSKMEQRDIDRLMLDQGVSHREAERYVRNNRQGKVPDFTRFVMSNTNRQHRIETAVTV
jgi:hypothetical protein